MQLGLPAHHRATISVQLVLLRGRINLNLSEFDKAHAAHTNRVQFGMITEYRDVIPDQFGGVHQVCTFGELVFNVVDVNSYGVGHSNLR